MKNKHIGDSAEKFVIDDCRKLYPEALFVNLAPSFPCDILGLYPAVGGGFKLVWIEVKSSKEGWPKLTPSEQEFHKARRAAGDLTKVFRLRKRLGEWTIRAISAW